MSNIGSDEEGRLRVELIREEHALRPLRDRISEVEKDFDSQLEALDRKSEVQDISHVIHFQNQTSESIRKQLGNLSVALEENEQRLRESVVEANRLSHTIEKAKEKVEADRRSAMAPLYDNLRRAQAELRFERNAQGQESRRPSLAINVIMDSAGSQAGAPGGTLSNINKKLPDARSHSSHESPSMKQAVERSFYAHRNFAPNIRPFTRPLMTCNDGNQEGGQQVTDAGLDRLSRAEKENFIDHESGHSRSTEQTRLAAVELEADIGVVYGPPETREPSVTSSSLTTFSTSPIDPYTPAGSIVPGGRHQSEEAEKPVEFIISNGYYISPECMKGVPIAKITEGDPYWVASWTKLNDWDPHFDDRSGRDKSIEYFSECDIHPNQLLAKEYYDEVGLCAVRYPIILRRILQVLTYANIEDPIQWFRNRLAQLITRHEKEGLPGSFPLKKTLKIFQSSDPIYKQYYKEHRYKSIESGPNNKKAQATRLETGLGQSDPSSKRARPNASPLSTERPGKLPRLGSVSGLDVYDVPEGERMITARSRNRDSTQMPPLLSPLLLDPAYQSAIEPSVSAARIKREGSKAIVSGGDVLFDLYFISCGKKEYGDNPPNLKFDAASGEILPLHPVSGDLSAKFPELVIRAPSLEQVNFTTGKEVGDIVNLKFKIGEGSRMQLGFHNADDAVLFVTFLSTYNEKLKLSAEDSKRIAEHGLFK